MDTSGADQNELDMLGLTKETPLFRGKGCEACAYTGYYGRQGIFELLVVNEAVRKMILKNADAGETRAVARQEGMKTLLEDGVEKVKVGMTTLREVLRVTQEV